MSKARMMDEWKCGMCLGAIGARPHVRIAVDIAVEGEVGGVSSLMDDEVVILAVFHTSCITETMDDDVDEDDMPYIREARSLVSALALHRAKRPRTPPAKAWRGSRFLVLNGGAR